jgi:hypothetical protein
VGAQEVGSKDGLTDVSHSESPTVSLATKAEMNKAGAKRTNSCSIGGHQCWSRMVESDVSGGGREDTHLRASVYKVAAAGCFVFNVEKGITIAGRHVVH